MVTETDNASAGSRSIRRRVIVVLPAPEGEDSTSRKPRRRSREGRRRGRDRRVAAHSMFCTCSRNCSIARLQREPDAGQLDVGRFRAQRVGLAVELLAQEIELTADRVVAAEQFARLRDVGAQPVQLLADIGARDEHRQFLRDPLLRHGRGETGELGEESFAIARGSLPAAPPRNLGGGRPGERISTSCAERTACSRPPSSLRAAARRSSVAAQPSRIAAWRAATTGSGSSSTVSMTPRSADEAV